MDGSIKKKSKKRRSKSPRRRAEDAGKKGGKVAIKKVRGLCSGTPEHREQRWKEYKARGGDKSRADWDKRYDVATVNSTKGSESVKKWHKELNFGKMEVEVKVEKDVYRRLDIADEDKKKGVEVKSGKYVCLDQFTKSEVERDGKLVQDKGWEINWIFEGAASQPLQDELTKNDIPFEFKSKLTDQ